ncbi:hypothetical protein K438DRAFT_1780244 [Mycena galopus ATCC 62051]|nr:hypothetical protein K438DRAFT_1780244 [Mycena galopus ATCC 62051]
MGNPTLLSLRRPLSFTVAPTDEKDSIDDVCWCSKHIRINIQIIAENAHASHLTQIPKLIYLKLKKEKVAGLAAKKGTKGKDDTEQGGCALTHILGWVGPHEGSVWQHSAYRMGSDDDRPRPRLGGKDDAYAAAKVDQSFWLGLPLRNVKWLPSSATPRDAHTASLTTFRVRGGNGVWIGLGTASALHGKIVVLLRSRLPTPRSRQSHRSSSSLHRSAHIRTLAWKATTQTTIKNRNEKENAQERSVGIQKK